MKAYISSLLVCSIIMVPEQLYALTAPADTIDKLANEANEQTTQPHYRLHPTMSCFICSTMDYENPEDNLCRVMRPHHNSPSGSQQNSHKLVNIGHHTTPMIGYAPTTTTTTTTTTGLYANPIDDEEDRHLGSSSPRSPIGDSTSDDGQSMTNSTGNSTLIQQRHQHQSSIFTAHHGNQAQTRLLPPTGLVRTRPCLEDENFCSIVSIVRKEFVNGNVLSRFWAMERNCSRSCNTGCMLIGERVRLSVCSSCCRTPNCNIGGGGSRMQVGQLLLALAGFLASLITSSSSPLSIGFLTQ